MSIGSVKPFHGAIVNGAAATVYTVPAGPTIVIKRLLVVGVVGANVTVLLAGQPVFYGETIAANKRLEQQLETPMVAGETIAAGASAAGIVLLVDGFHI